MLITVSSLCKSDGSATGPCPCGRTLSCLPVQVQEDCPGNLTRWYRHISKGAWPFSSRDHGWPIADCSAEGLKVLPCKEFRV